MEIHKLSGLVNRPDWDQFMVWLDEKRASCIDKLELCKPEDLKGHQQEIRLIKELLTLRNSVNTISK